MLNLSCTEYWRGLPNIHAEVTQPAVYTLTNIHKDINISEISGGNYFNTLKFRNFFLSLLENEL